VKPTGMMLEEILVGQGATADLPGIMKMQKLIGPKGLKKCPRKSHRNHRKCNGP
jgi:hypothetical protein